MQDMTRKLRYLFVLLFLTMTGRALAQTGSISGTVYDEKKEPIIGAIVQVFEAGATRGGAATDIDGNYVVKPLNPSGNYEVHVKYAGYKEIVLKGVLVSPDKITKLNFNMQINAKELEEVVVTTYKVPLIEADKPGSTTTFTREQIAKLPTRNTSDVASLSAGVYQSKSGGNVSIAGGRSTGTQYIIDGVMVQGNTATNLPPGSIDQMSVITSGIPAKYGDASGGIISITTRGGAPKHTGEVGVEHSLDGFGHNMAYFSLAGPLLKKKVDSVNKKTVLGYSLNGSYISDKDNNPNYFDNYVLKADRLKEIQQNPLVQTTDISGRKIYHPATEYVTMNDLETTKTRINADYKSARLVGKLNYQLSDNVDLVAGGNYTYINQSLWDQRYELFSPDAMPKDIIHNGRAYIRLTQSFGKNSLNNAEGENKKAPLISNAFYTLQADYENTHTNIEDPKLKHNPFLYGYVGKFVTRDQNIYYVGLDTAINRTGTVLYAYNSPTAVDFTPSDVNPLLTNYTKQFYSLAGSEGYPTTLNDIQAGSGLLNGQLPNYVYGSDIFYNSGFSRGGYYYNDAEQFAFNVDASFDFQPKKTRHAIEFGLYYQQRAERTYSILPASVGNTLWGLMRQLTNRHLLDLDKGDPIYIINGQRYTLDEYRNGNLSFGPNDTVIYNKLYNESLQSTFDYNLRKKLNLDPTGKDHLYVDSYDPSIYSLDMFSPDELINGGVPLASWYGYDYTGKRINGQVNFNDFFTKKNAKGDYTREIGAFRPNYIAGYIQDKFELPNNVLFNVGLRVERFDANTKVLRDPYSLYAVHTVADNKDAVNSTNGDKNPDNIGGNYVIYVDNNQADHPDIIGYRNGDDWYDATGKFLQDPTLLGPDPQPYLVKSPGQNRSLRMNEAGYDPNTSFTDYKPQVNVMPRINFSFPIAEQSLFYAHYDVYVMRPKTAGEIYVSPIEYLYLSQNANQIIANPNLKPERVFDYELGFQQTLSQNSAVTINGFYKERKDMIQIRPFLNAYPNTYFTYGNRDFSTTKGFSLKYDLRRVNHLQLQLSYTLQFAEGTGSSSSSGNGGSSTSVSNSGLLKYLLGAGLPNLRFALPLDIDSRHILNANLDYRYEKGEGPVIGNTHPLENAGINLVFRARSGEPYTRYAFPGQKIVVGGAYGARKPWHYMMDLRIDKTFGLFSRTSVDGIKQPSRIGLTAFLYIQNLLNTRDILDVYGYTGRPDNDGWIASPAGQLEASVKTSPQSYMDLYNLSRLDQDFLNNPRRINLGISLNF
jgi:outer membrane receptor protein involved in Fe transport